MPRYGTEVNIKESGQGTPAPEPFELNVLNTGKGAGKPSVKLKFHNDTQKKVHIVIAEEGVSEEKEFSIEKNHHKEINLKKTCPRGAHLYSMHYANEAPPNEDPRIIVDDDVDG